ncbi:toll/interleukin-1 receptor domain-containing protein [Serratia marcescens]|nr:toll/interleukin-1 receptor domain-containing protein [Serratia marcescens]MBN5275599.1 toll/interleukin-1 receptor domain-containing protein [Serratia marcescens]MBN5306800.1 toll/interleukin-1 receptor domain-containing protein [Serratia marcescens]MBN5363163.1 toll/interleukin-1 receptor domain-containing protein [Serratia marcescens]MBN5421505.1 toll/interleukin-1 receptor domain-containing protein [Serratia marcescens]
MASVFLSHNSNDKPFVRKLAMDLQGQGHVVWIDEAEINIGDSLVEKIREGLDKVDFVAAVLSSNSISSPWVQRELDISSNREIAEKRVILLPLMLEKVELPGFLFGKLYADFTTEDIYAKSLEGLLRALGPVDKHINENAQDNQALLEELNLMKDRVEALSRLQSHQSSTFKDTWTPELKARVEIANEKYPDHKVINDSYAFNAIGNEAPVTLDYLLWAIGKTIRQGAHPLEALMDMGGTYSKAQQMIEAYIAYIGNN